MIDLFRLISMNSRSRSLRHRLAEKEAPAQIEDASTATPMPASFWTPFLTPELRFALTFLLIYLLLQGLYQQLPIGWIEASFIEWGAVRPSAALIDWLSPQSSTRIDGTAIVGQQAHRSSQRERNRAKGPKLRRETLRSIHLDARRATDPPLEATRPAEATPTVPQTPRHLRTISRWAPSHQDGFSRGTQVLVLRAEAVEDALSLLARHGSSGVSRNDVLALALARQERCALLTGDKRLRAVAAAERSEVFGTLWLVEQLVDAAIIDVALARTAYASMRANGRRLPWPEVQRQLEKLAHR